MLTNWSLLYVTIFVLTVNRTHIGTTNTETCDEIVFVETGVLHDLSLDGYYFISCGSLTENLKQQ